MISIGKTITPAEKEKVREFLSRIKPYLKTNEYQIQVNHKNKNFDRSYPLRDKEKRQILESLTEDDCIEIENNNNPRYDNAEVFVFLKQVSIPVYGEIENIELYIKMYMKEYDRSNIVIVISFHPSGEYE